MENKLFKQLIKGSRRAVAAVTVAALAAGIAVFGVAAPATADATAPSIQISKAPREGGLVTVTGTGFTSTINGYPGVYVGVGKSGSPDFYRASMTDGVMSEVVFAKLNGEPTNVEQGRVERLDADGSFSFTVTAPAFDAGQEFVVYTSIAHGIGMGNASLNTITGIEYLPADRVVTVNGSGFTEFPSGVYVGVIESGATAAMATIKGTKWVAANQITEGVFAQDVTVAGDLLDSNLDLIVWKGHTLPSADTILYRQPLADGLSVDVNWVKPVAVSVGVAAAAEGSLTVQLDVENLAANAKVYAALIEAGTVADLQDMASAKYAAFALPFPTADADGVISATFVAPGEKLDRTKEYQVVVWRVHSAATDDNIYGIADLEITNAQWDQIFPAPAPSVPVDIKNTAAPVITGTATFGSTLNASTGKWSVEGVELSYQWLRDGKAISGATKSSYQLSLLDLSKKISVKVTASKSDFNSASSTSASKTVLKAAATKFTTVTKISGNAVFNSTLKVSAGKLSVKGASYKYQWLRDGKAIAGATKSSYKLTSKDVAKRISVKVVAVKSGHTDGTVVSAKSAKVAKATPSVKLKLSKTSIKKSQSAKATITIKASGVSKPVGKVTVKVGKKTFTKTVKASHKGKVTITVKGLKAGKKQKVTAKFTPSGSSKTVLVSKSAASKRLTVK